MKCKTLNSYYTVKKNRNLIVDSLRGFGILLVVIGHLIQMKYDPLGYDSNIFFRLIYSFHMALFFVISGYCYKDKGLINEVRQSIIRLILPFIFFYYVVSCRFDLVLFFSSFTSYLLNPQLGFWFFFVLFFIRVGVSILLRFSLWWRCIFFIIYFVILYNLGTFYSAHYIIFYTPIFLLGYLINIKIATLIRDAILNYSKNFLLYIIGLCISIYLIVFIFFYSRNLMSQSIILFIFQKMILSIIGLLIVALIFIWLNQKIPLDLIALIGRHTTAIYGLHLMFISTFEYIGWGSVVIMMAIPLFISIIYKNLILMLLKRYFVYFMSFTK